MIGKSNKIRGFHLLESAVVIVIIGVLVSFAVPRLRGVVERSKVNEAFMFLEEVKASQEKYHVREGKYANNLNSLGIKKSYSKYYIIGIIQAGSTGSIKNSWFLMLTRKNTGSGAYTIAFTEEGFDRTNSTIVNMPDINTLAGL